MLDRRRFLTATAAAAAAGFLPEKSQVLKAMPAAESEFGKVKVTDVKTASVMIKYPAHLVKVETDSGLYGIGEAFNGDGVLDHIKHLIRDRHRTGPAASRLPLPADGRAKAGPRLLDRHDLVLHLRHRDGAVGPGGKNPQGAGLCSARRQVSRQGAALSRHRLPEDGRPGAMGGRGREDARIRLSGNEVRSRLGKPLSITRRASLSVQARDVEPRHIDRRDEAMGQDPRSDS